MNCKYPTFLELFLVHSVGWFLISLDIIIIIGMYAEAAFYQITITENIFLDLMKYVNVIF